MALSDYLIQQVQESEVKVIRAAKAWANSETPKTTANLLKAVAELQLASDKSSAEFKRNFGEPPYF